MRKVLFVLLGVLAVESLSAVAVTWNWNSNAGTSLNGSSSFYFVYSESRLTSGTQVVSAVNASLGENVKGYGSATGAEGDTAGSSFVPNVPSGPQTVVKGNATNITGYTNHVGLGNVALQSGHYYLVVFNDPNIEDATKYAVAQAGALGGVAVENGYLQVSDDQFVLPGNPPLPGQFIDPTWMFGTFRDAAPEPTALALLALGVAGAALRRRVR